MNKTLLGKVDHLLCYDCLLFSDSNEYRPRDNTNRQILQGRENVSKQISSWESVQHRRQVILSAVEIKPIVTYYKAFPLFICLCFVFTERKIYMDNTKPTCLNMICFLLPVQTDREFGPRSQNRHRFDLWDENQVASDESDFPALFAVVNVFESEAFL